ncbi:MAG: putative binding protein component of ABC iron transporter precursor [Dehalococcoidia bacterium]|nr:putative binding protein component of ABC iron transporter precursor [Dehalococcoidia bacterium]
MDTRSFRFIVISFIVVIITLLSAACRPQAAAPQTAPPAVAATPGQPKPATPSLTSEQVAWNKVLEEAKREGTVTAYSFSLTGDIAKAAMDAFQKQYGIRLEIVGGVGATLAERIKTENNAKKYVADTFDTAVTGIAPLKKLGMLADTRDLPVLKEKDVWVFPPVLDPADGTMLQVRPTYQPTIINTTLVRPEEEPKSFLDFLNPKWKGRKLAAAPPRVSWPLVYLHVTLPDIINETYLRALGNQDLLMVSTMRDEATAVARGEALATVANSLSTVGPLVGSGAPLKALAMKEGTVGTATAISVLKNAPHPNAARVFTNWWLSPEGQTAVNKAVGSPNIRKDVPDFSYEATRIKPTKLLILDEAANDVASRYVAEGRVDKFIGMEVK